MKKLLKKNVLVLLFFGYAIQLVGMESKDAFENYLKSNRKKLGWSNAINLDYFLRFYKEEFLLDAYEKMIEKDVSKEYFNFLISDGFKNLDPKHIIAYAYYKSMNGKEISAKHELSEQSLMHDYLIVKFILKKDNSMLFEPFFDWEGRDKSERDIFFFYPNGEIKLWRGSSGCRQEIFRLNLQENFFQEKRFEILVEWFKNSQNVSCDEASKALFDVQLENENDEQLFKINSIFLKSQNLSIKYKLTKKKPSEKSFTVIQDQENGVVTGQTGQATEAKTKKPVENRSVLQRVKNFFSSILQRIKSFFS
jgi:hypothetical protein